ncbi:transposase [Streptomyces sp. NPDC058145]|uniref:transposase n=1 Tax=Streptomyces sp. NPDC058145 TaxID=3346356 RepID=UPI0036E77E87
MNGATSCRTRKLYRSCTRATIRFPDLVRHYWRAQRLWSGSYFAGSVGGASLSFVKQYIERQNRPL